MNRDEIAIIVIGRNEGEALRVCLTSSLRNSDQVIYVDSQSEDNSVGLARSMGVKIVTLNLDKPITAARARNAGFEYLKNQFPDAIYVQFVDGDCELEEDWVSQAHAVLSFYKKISLVCGRRRERHPEVSIFNALCDIEWDTPCGVTNSCGGDFMVKVQAFEKAGGFNSSLIAGEEPEFCLRLRQKGHKLLRLDHAMTIHDAKIEKFSQWWSRARRAGYAYATWAQMYPNDADFKWRHSCLRIWFWGLLIPAIILVAAVLQHLSALMLLCLYPIQISRIAFRERKKIKHNWAYATFVTIAKFAQINGQLSFLSDRIKKTSRQIIEYN